MQAASGFDHRRWVAPHQMSSDDVAQLGEQIADLAAHIDCATHALLTRLRAFDLAGGWHQAGALSCAHWLSWRIGMSLGTARDKLRVAHRLAELPHIDQAFSSGRLSYSKVRAMVRVATGENEEHLLRMAETTTAAQLDKICRLRRSVDRWAEGGEPQPAPRYLSQRDTDDGMVAVTLVLLPDEAARFVKAAEVCAEGQSLIDGAVHLADQALANPGADQPVRPPVEAVVHVSAEDLTGYTEDGQGVSAETCRRLLCDSGIVPMLENEQGQTVDVGRKTRVIPAAVRRALGHRDGGCQFPGCTHRRFVDAHHVEHWVDGGETKLDNLTQLCRFHHVLVHEQGYSIHRRPDGHDGWDFLDPSGRVVPPTGERPVLADPVSDLIDWNRQRLGEHNPIGQVPGWDGWPIDYPACVDSLG